MSRARAAHRLRLYLAGNSDRGNGGEGVRVKELKRLLEGVDDELLVVLQRYADEPRYSLLAGAETAKPGVPPVAPGGT